MRCKSPLMPQQISSVEPQENAAQSASGRQYKTHGALHGHSTKLAETPAKSLVSVETVVCWYT